MTNTLTKATDTPKAIKAVRVVSPNVTVVTTKTVPTVAAPAPSAAKSSALDVAAFVAAYKADSVSVATKARIVGKSIASGAETVAIIANALIAALTAQDLIVPKSFASSITHYATAYAAAAKAKVSGNDSALHAAYQISTGVVKAKVRNEFIDSFKGEPAEFVTGCRALITAAREAKKTPATPAPVDGPTVTEETELEVISPIADFKGLIKQARALLKLAGKAENDSDYFNMLESLFEFTAEFEMVEN